MNLRVALIDDHQPYRERLRTLLEEDREIEIVAEAGSGQQILEIALVTEIDVACMDIHMPGMSGIEATRHLLASRPNVRVIGLSAYAEQHYVEAMLDAGAVGYFTKADAGESLLRAIHTANRDRPHFGADVPIPDAELAPAVTEPELPTANADLSSLSNKELQVLRLLAQGLGPAQIARSLPMDPVMVEVYCRNVTRKLKLNDKAVLAEYARRIDLGGM